MIIQALPGLGKSFIANKYYNVLDTDKEILRYLPVKQPSDWEGLSTNAKKWFAHRYRLLSHDTTHHLVTNLHLAQFGLTPDMVVYVHPNKYVKHLSLIGRSDLLKVNQMAPNTLQSWASAYNRPFKGRFQPKRFAIKPGTFLEQVMLNHPHILLHKR